MEVVLALGIASFALVAVVALLPLGLKSSADSYDESREVDLASIVVADRVATPYGSVSTRYQLPILTNSLTTPIQSSFGVGEDGTLSSNAAATRYRVSYVLTPPATGRLDPYLLWVRVASGTGSTNAPAGVEIVTALPQ